MIIPEFIDKGDKIAILSTARKITSKEIFPSLEIIETWELIPVIGNTIDLEEHQFAGSDQERAEDFQRAIDNPQIKAIWCARGGYGTVRIIDQIDFSNFVKQPKWIIGYSDITVLHTHLHTMGIASLHAPMPIDMHNGTKESIKSLKNVLFGYQSKYTITPHKKNRLGFCIGQLIGGNLSILYSLCGSRSALDTKGKILCIEDLDEYLYHIDRMLQNLKRNGYFDQLAGLIIGGMTKMHDNTIPFGKKVKDIVLDTIQTYDFPVVFDFPMGHIKDNRALILGAEISLEITKTNVTLSYI